MVAVIPCVFDVVACGFVSFFGAVAFVVVEVIERAVGRDAVVGAGDVAGVGAVAGGIVGVGFVGLIGVRRPGELAGIVVSVIAGSVAGDKLRDATVVVERNESGSTDND